MAIALSSFSLNGLRGAFPVDCDSQSCFPSASAEARIMIELWKKSPKALQ
jgi:hypothetical protein